VPRIGRVIRVTGSVRRRGPGFTSGWRPPCPPTVFRSLSAATSGLRRNCLVSRACATTS